MEASSKRRTIFSHRKEWFEKYKDILTEDQWHFLRASLENTKNGSWKINEEGLMDIEGDFICNDDWKGQRSLDGFFGLNFGTINGNFICSNHMLTSLKGSPRYIKGDFNASHNQIQSTKDGPIRVEGNYYINNNKSLISFEDVSEDTIGGSFNFYGSRLAMQTHNDIWSYMKRKQTIFEIALVAKWNDILKI